MKTLSRNYLLNLKAVASLAGCILVLFFITGCGSGSTVQSLQFSPTSGNLVGIGATQNFALFATYSSGRAFDVTGKATYTISQPNPLGPVTPPNAITFNPSGTAESVLGACTWTEATINGTNTFGTQPYLLTASFGGQTTTAFVSVASLAGCQHP